jgi:hypothetical protein
MLFKELIAVYSENHTKLINTLCGQNAELLTVKAGGTQVTVTTELQKVKFGHCRSNPLFSLHPII